MSMDKTMAALSFIPPHDRDLWVRMGMAVKAEFGEDGFDAWDNWSQGAESYNVSSAKSVWRSIGAAGKIGIGTLFHEAKAQGWRDDTVPRGPATPEEIEAKRLARAARDAAVIAEEARKGRGYRLAAVRAKHLIDACQLKPSNYLSGKGLPDTLTLDHEGVLVVPMRDMETNELRGVQTITFMPGPRVWEKKMAPGMRAKGAVLRLGSKQAKETFLCEGYATGLSIELALRRLRLQASVLICFSDSNLAYVATMVKGAAFVFADNDPSQAGEEAAKKARLPYCMSPVVGEDANDLHVRAGMVALCKMLIDLRRRSS